MNTWDCQTFLAGVLASSAACGTTSIDDMRTTGDIQGLFEIREAAQEFVAAYNAKTGTEWRAMEPDLRVLVGRCMVSMKVRWKPRTVATRYPVTLVSCGRSAPADPKPHPWVVEVPVDIQGSK